MKRFLSIPLGFVLLLIFFVPSTSMAVSDAIIPKGQKLNLQLNKTLSTKEDSEGDLFTAVVTTPVYLKERVMIPKGSVVNGRISRITRPGRFTGKAVMSLLFQSIYIPGHEQLPIIATLVSMDSKENGEVGTEGYVEGGGSSSVGRIVGPGLVGAGLGALIGNSKGAGIGAGLGVAAGLITVLTQTPGKDIEISRGSMLVIELKRPLTIPAEGDAAAIRNR
jgi:hypothetical protein